MINVVHAFSGVDSQYMAEKRIWGKDNINVIGTMEVDIDAIISCALIHHKDEFNIFYNQDWSNEDYSYAKNILKERNIGFDFEKNKSKIDRLKKDKLKQLYISSIITKNYGDISLANKIKLKDDIDLFTYSSPCQSFSIAGKQEGLNGVSGLLLECENFIKLNQPKVLLLENVKNLVGKKFIGDFNNWLNILDDLGYNSYWKVLNAKDFGVPQNRERVFCLSIRKDIDNNGYNFPNSFQLNKRLKDILDINIDEKYYYNNEKAKELMKVVVEKYNKKDIIPCDSTLNQPKELEVANCITARYDAGIQNQRSIGVAVVEPTIVEVRVDEGVRFFKDNICGGDKAIIELQQNRIGGIFDDEKGKHQAGSIWDKEGLAPTLDTMQGGYRQPMITDNFKIRKLTPKECWKLMDFDTDAFDKVKDYISDSQLYKQAGNSIVVACLEHIFKNLKDIL